MKNIYNARAEPRENIETWQGLPGSTSSSDSRRIVVSYKRNYVHKVLVNSCLPRKKSVVRWTLLRHNAYWNFSQILVPIENSVEFQWNFTSGWLVAEITMKFHEIFNFIDTHLNFNEILVIFSVGWGGWFEPRFHRNHKDRFFVAMRPICLFILFPEDDERAFCTAVCCCVSWSCWQQ